LGRAARVVGGTLVAWGLLTTLVLLTGAGGLYRIGEFRIRIQSLTRALEFVVVGLVVLAAVSPRLRAFARQALRSPLAFFAACFLVAAYFSLGPDPRAGGDQINGPPIYAWLYAVVPGFDGLRVPARFAAVSALFLTLAAGWGLRDLLSRRKHAGALVMALSAWWMLETAVLPFPMARVPAADTPDVLAPPADLPQPDALPGIYRQVQTLPRHAVLLELPMGDISWELRYMFASIGHWRPMVNGYSGYAPAGYLELVSRLRNPLRDPEEAWQRLAASTVTHVIVHRRAYYPGGIPLPEPWLRAHGATLLAENPDASLYSVR
jgi:hypothetical protein